MERLISRLKKVRRVGKGYMACCPAHADSSPSLSVTQAEDGKTLVKCFAGCKTEDVVAAVGLQMSDLFPEDHSIPEIPRTVVCTYDYTDAAGELVFQVVRYAPKDFRQRRPDGKGDWEWNLSGVPRLRPLYRLPELLAADPNKTVFLCAGEKDADNLTTLGLVATTKAGGEKNWGEADATPLTGRKVCILQDKDDTGRKYAPDVADDLAGKAKSVKVLEAPGSDLVKDISDWLEIADELGLSQDEIIAELRTLVVGAPEWVVRQNFGGLIQPAEVKSELRGEFEAEQRGERQSIELPWPSVDFGTNALKPGTVTIVGGPAGYGKSFLVLQIAIHAHSQCTWALLPLEDKRTDWERRALAYMAHTWEVLDGKAGTAANRIAIAEQYRSDLDALIANVWENPTLAKKDKNGRAKVPSYAYQEALDWTAKALESRRLVIIDPLAKIEFPGFQPWQAEKDFVRQLVGIASHSGGSVILVVHTVKRTGAAALAPLTAEDLQGAAELNRLVQTVLLLEFHGPRVSDVRRNGFTGEVNHTRTLAIGKARFGPGMGERNAMSMSNAAFEELGVIVPPVRTRKGAPHA